MYDDTTIGARLRVLRKWRNLTLVELAEQAGISKTHLSGIELGQRALDRRSYIAQLASALRVSETDLVGGPHLSADPIQAGPHSVIPALRVALQTNTLSDPGGEHARALKELVAETRALQPVYRKCDYIELGRRLPLVIDELHLHIANPEDEQAQRTALETLVEALRYVVSPMKDLGYPDLAHQAAARADEAARLHGDPVLLGKAAYLRIQTMPRNGNWNRTLVAAERAVNALHPHAQDVEGRSTLGMLTLMSALAAAVDHKVDTAGAWLAEARELASLVPDDPLSNWGSFCTTNIGVWNVALGVEHGETGKSVLEKAKLVNQQTLAMVPSRYSMYLADVGRGLARDPHSKQAAVTWLQQAERIAPSRIRNSKPVRETVAVMLEQGRMAAAGRELRGMAARMGIPH